MSTGRDDALSWEGDDDPTLDPRTAAPVTTPPADGSAVDGSASKAFAGETDATPTALPDGYTAVGRGSDEVGRIAPDGSVTMPGKRRPMGNATLIGLGVLGGIYLLYAIGWIIGGLRLQGGAQYLVTDVMYQGSLWIAVLSPFIWFGTVFLLTTASKPWVRFAWMIAGVVLLLPWPLVMIGAVGL